MIFNNDPKKKIKVIFDSNAFFVPFQFKIDVFEQLKVLLNVNYEAILLSQVYKELEKLIKEGSPKMSKKSSFALNIAKQRCKFIKTEKEYEGSADDVIVETAKEWNAAVFTNDKQLKKRLRNINLPVIYVRQRTRLEVDGRI